MDKINFLAIAATIKAIKPNLPNDDELEMNHVEDYHTFLRELQEEVSLNLARFQIPSNAIKTRDELTDLRYGRHGLIGSTTPKQYCDANVFRRQLDALILFIDSYLDGLRADQAKKK